MLTPLPPLLKPPFLTVSGFRLWRGAPAGLSASFSDIGDTLPKLEPDATISPDELDSCPDSFANHGDLDDDPEALGIIEGYASQGWLKEFSSYR